MLADACTVCDRDQRVRPMYFRESSTPAQDDWEALFDVPLILDRFGFSGEIAELGCGYGTFTLPLARRSRGTVHVLHYESPVELMREARRILRPHGMLAVIHWRSDIVTPRGPPLEIRPTASKIIEWATSAGQLDVRDRPFSLPPWHFGVAFTYVVEKPRAPATRAP